VCKRFLSLDLNTDSGDWWCKRYHREVCEEVKRCCEGPYVFRAMEKMLDENTLMKRVCVCSVKDIFGM
jgi:hypothetical protein